MSDNPVVITHGGCPDGTAAAYVLLQKYPQAYVHYAFVRNFNEDKNMPMLHNKDLIIVDYSYPADIIEMLSKICKSITIYDHHITTQNNLSSLRLKNVKIHIELNKCGGEIAWDIEFPKVPHPWWMVHIRDRDLWLWDNPQSHAFSEAFSEMGVNLENMRKIAAMTPTEIADFYSRGQLLYDFRTKTYSKICDTAEYVYFAGYKVYAINTTAFQSDIGNILAKRLGADFAVVYRYCVSTSRWYISLRGTKHSPNLADLAKRLAAENGTEGGGHPRAAGYEYTGNFPLLLTPL